MRVIAAKIAVLTTKMVAKQLKQEGDKGGIRHLTTFGGGKAVVRPGADKNPRYVTGCLL